MSNKQSCRSELTALQRENLMRYMPQALTGEVDKQGKPKCKPVMSLTEVIEKKPPVRQVRRLFKKKILEYTDEDSFSE